MVRVTDWLTEDGREVRESDVVRVCFPYYDPTNWEYGRALLTYEGVVVLLRDYESVHGDVSDRFDLALLDSEGNIRYGDDGSMLLVGMPYFEDMGDSDDVWTWALVR